MEAFSSYLRIGLAVMAWMVYSQGGMAQDQTVGLFLNSPQSYDGYTLFTNSTDTYLIDNCGFMVHQWESEYRPGLAVYLLADGSILRTGRAAGVFNGGGAGGVFEKIDWDGNVVWSYVLSNDERQAHHDIAPLPNGNFLALVWTDFPSEDVIAAGRTASQGMWMEQIVEIEMVGSDEIEIVWEWNLQDHLVQDGKPDFANFGSVSASVGKMDLNYIPEDTGLNPDWAHLNSIDYNEELDQIIVSSKNMNEVWIIDHSTTTAEAKTSTGGNAGRGGDFLYRYGNPQLYDRGGPDDQVLFGQHNAEWISAGLPNAGTISVFNNGYEAGRSQLVRWTPPRQGFQYVIEGESASYGPADFDWSYESEVVYSQRLSSAQFLPNGNVLACVGGDGRFVEVTPDRSVVWDYKNPIRSTGFPVIQGQSATSTTTFRCLRYGRDYPAFEGRDLDPIIRLELVPLPSDCEIYEVVNTTESSDLGTLTIYGNVVGDRLVVELPEGVDRLFAVDQTGQLTDLAVTPHFGIQDIFVAGLSTGIYYLRAIGHEHAWQSRFVKL